MRHATLVVGVLTVLGAGNLAFAQPAERRHLVGDRFGGKTSMTNGGETIETTTLTFNGRDGGPTLSIEFITRLPGLGRPAHPSVVDIIVTENQPADASPSMSMRVDEAAMPLHARLNARRSVAATISFNEFVRLANAGSIVQSAFDVDLELNAMQRGMLRSTASRWAGRSR